MTYISNRDPFVEVARERVQGQSTLLISGTNDAISGALAPINNSGIYRTPITLTSLEILSDNANDTSAGTGARTVLVTGLGTDWNEVTETVTLNGTTPVALANQYYRIREMEVATSGTYGTTGAGSHAGIITLRGAGGGSNWARIDFNGGTYALGRSQISCYTVPNGFSAYILRINVSIESQKIANVLFMTRNNADTVTAPYSGVITRTILDGLTGFATTERMSRIKLPAKTDFIPQAFIASPGGIVSVNYEVLLIAD